MKLKKAQQTLVFQAISHPVRRVILDSLKSADIPAMQLPGGLSPSALSQHLTVLKKARLVKEKRSGRQRIYSLNAKPLYQAFQWLADYESFWGQAFNKLDNFLRETHGKEKED